MAKKTDHLPQWGNGRPEFRPPFTSIDLDQVAQVADLPKSFDFSDEKEARLVLEIYQQLTQISLSIRYQDAKGNETERVVTPLALALNNGNWGFFAHCELRDNIRWFRFDRIHHIDPMSPVRELDPYEIAMRLVAMPPHERQSILDALEVLDPEMFRRIGRYGYKRRDYTEPETVERTFARTDKKGRKVTSKASIPKKVSRNKEGLSWGEWSHAAGVSRTQSTSTEKDAWKDGVDPSEYRSMMRRPEKKSLADKLRARKKQS